MHVGRSPTAFSSRNRPPPQSLQLAFQFLFGRTSRSKRFLRHGLESSWSPAVWEGRGPALSKALIRYQLSGGDDGPTTFTYTNEFKTPGGPLGNVASRVMVGGASEKEARRSLSKLKELLERR